MKPPVPPAESPHGYDMEPLMRSLFSCSVFSAIADVDHDAPAPGQPSVTLFEWWLATVEGDDQKIAVDGLFKRNQTLYQLCPRPIAKRRSPNILESEDGTTLLLSGSLNISRTLGNGYSNTVCEHFMVGFPLWWQNCNLRYPKQTNLDTGCQPCSSNTSNYGVEHFDSYRPSFISKHPDGLKSSSHNDSVFPKSSHLSNGTPRFEEHTCDGNIATNENAAASSEAGKEGQRTPVVTLEVRGCREDTQHMALTEKEAVYEEMPTPIYLDVQNTFSLSDGTPILEEYTCDGDIPTNEDAAASNDDNERYTAPSKEVNNVEIGLIAGSPSSERGHDHIATDVSLASTVQCTHNAVSGTVDSTPATDCKKTPVACLKNQVSLAGNQHIASNKKPVGRPTKQIFPHEKRQIATRSYSTRSAVSREKHASTGGWSHTLSPTCSATPGLLAGSPSNERGHDDIATDVSLTPTVQCTNNAVSEALYSTPATDRKTTPVACLKNQGSLGGNQHIASNKKPVGRPKKPHEKRKSATRSHGIRSPVSQEKQQGSKHRRVEPYALAHVLGHTKVLWSPLTRSKATSMSISTPEALELKRTRSGRVIVPHLDGGCQSIVYGRDGLITGVIGLDSPAMPKRSESKTNRRKKRTE